MNLYIYLAFVDVWLNCFGIILALYYSKVLSLLLTKTKVNADNPVDFTLHGNKNRWNIIRELNLCTIMSTLHLSSSIHKKYINNHLVANKEHSIVSSTQFSIRNFTVTCHILSHNQESGIEEIPIKELVKE